MTDLRVLFPDASPAQLDRIRRATERIEPASWDAGLVLIGTVPLDEAELELCVGTVDGEPAISV